jgi:ankyrin repeat protein
LASSNLKIINIVATVLLFIFVQLQLNKMDQGPSKFPYTVLSPLHSYLIDDCIKAFIIGDKTKAIDVMSRFSTVNADIVLLFPKWYLYKLSNHVSYLHLAAYNGWLDVMEELILNHHFKLSSHDKEYIHPLHYTCAGGHIDCVKYFIQKRNCLPNIVDDLGLQPIHVACSMGKLNIVKFFIEELKIDPLVNTANDFSPFHYACLSGNVMLMEYLLSKIPLQKKNSTLNSTNFALQAPIHFACLSYSINPVQFLVLTQSVDLMAKDMYGFTPLHTACSTGCTSIVEYLLSLQSVDPSATDYRKRTPVEVVPLMHNNELKILKLFANTRAIPYLNNYTKVFFCGHPRNGKSSLATVIDTRSKIPSNFLKEVFTLSKLVDGVPEFTEGIVPYNIQSSEVGNLILYDFAGDHEYYSSHIAVLHKLRLPGIFVIFINLLKDILDIYDELCFWLNFVNNFKSNAGMSKLIVVGSHADKVPLANKKELFRDIERLIKKGIESLPIHNFHFISFVPLDCRCLKSENTNYFIKSLSSACETVLEKSDTISFDCLIVYTILQKKSENFIALDVIIAVCNHLEFNVNVIDTIHKLHDKGLIFFFEGPDPSCSYVIVHTEKLLHDINGKLFAPSSELQLAPSNIGLIPLSNLCVPFLDDVDPIVLADFLTSLGFCFPFDPSTQNIFTESPPNAEIVLFFPSLVQKKFDLADIEFFDNSLCWCLCTDTVFPNFFLQTIQLEFSHSFCSPKSNIGRKWPFLHKTLDRKCIVWKNGIYWKTINCVSVFIEMNEMNRQITLYVSNNDKCTAAYSLNLRSKLVNAILKIQKEICPSCNVEEFCVYPQSFNAVLSTNLSELKACSITTIAQAVVNKYPKISSDTLQADCDTKAFIGNDPYYHLSPSSIQHLFTCTSGDLPNYILKELRDLPLITFKSYDNLEAIRDTLNDHSIFCGRNPLDLIPDIEMKHIFSYSTEIDLATALKMTKDLRHRWEILGLHLGISRSDMDVIEQNQRGDCVNCCSKMLSTWIDKQKEKASVEALQDAITRTNSFC